MTEKRIQPEWGKAVRKVLIKRDMSINDLAESIGMSRTHVSAVVNGRLLSENAKEKICSFLGVEE